MAKQIDKSPLEAKEKERVISEFAKYLQAAKQQKIHKAFKLLRKSKEKK